MAATGETGITILPIIVFTLIIVIAVIAGLISRYNKNHPRIEGDKTRGSISPTNNRRLSRPEELWTSRMHHPSLLSILVLIGY
jgi:hypothetical protein